MRHTRAATEGFSRRSMGPNARAVLAVGGVLLLLPLVGPSAVVVAAVRPLATPPTPHGFYQSNVTGPAGFADAGSRLLVAYHLRVAPPATLPAAGLVHVPAALAEFGTATGRTEVYVPATNLSVPAGGQPTTPVNATVRLSAPQSFTRGASASISTAPFAI